MKYVSSVTECEPEAHSLQMKPVAYVGFYPNISGNQCRLHQSDEPRSTHAVFERCVAVE